MDELASLVAALNATWFGSGLPAAAQTRLASIARKESIAAGTEILVEGEVTSELGIVLEGRVALRTLVPERGMVTILTVEEGDVFGWSAIVPPYRASSTVIAIEPVVAVSFDGAELRNALREDAALAAVLYPRLIQVVARRLTATRLQLLDLFARDQQTVQ